MSWPIAGGGVTVMWDWQNPGDGHGSGAIRQYHLPGVRDAVVSRWTEAFGNGQRRIAICTEYFEQGTSFHLDSSDGLNAQDKANLKAALTDAKGIGFAHVLLETGPAWSASPANWMDATVMGSMGFTPRPFEPLSYGRNFRFVMEQYDVLQAAGLPDFGIDSHTEAIHGGAMEPKYLAYLQRWWSDVTDEIGLDHNAGLSTPDVCPDVTCVDNMVPVYVDGPLPRIILSHAYGAPGQFATGWAAFKARLAAKGLDGRGHLVGETYSDDPEVAAVLNADSNIFWWLAWPIGTDTVGIQDRYATGYLGPK